MTLAPSGGCETVARVDGAVPGFPPSSGASVGAGPVASRAPTRRGRGMLRAVSGLDRVRVRLDRVRAAVGEIDPVFLDTPALPCAPGAWALGDAEGRDAQPGPELQGARHGDGGSRGARHGCGARGVRERRESRAGAGFQRLPSRPGGHRRGSENRQPAQAAPDRRLRRGRADRWRGHRGRPTAGARDRGGGSRISGRGQLGSGDLRGCRHDRPRDRSR
jgi:hypothetical protein